MPTDGKHKKTAAMIKIRLAAKRNWKTEIKYQAGNGEYLARLTLKKPV